MKLFPWDDVVANAKEKMDQGFRCYQQFNCEHCGTKQTMPDPNVFWELGTCEECGKTTNIKRNGCNVMVTIGV